MGIFQRYRLRLLGLIDGIGQWPFLPVFIAFWLFGLINNTPYVLLLSAAQDLVGASVPKALVLLADVLPSFVTKLTLPYLLALPSFAQRVPYAARILFIATASSAGLILVAITPQNDNNGAFIPAKLFGVALASLASGAGELTFLGLTHYYGSLSLAAWGSGTGGAGLVGAGIYVLFRDVLRLSVRATLLCSAILPGIMLIAFFSCLPRGNIDGVVVPSANTNIGAVGVQEGLGADAYSALLTQDLENAEFDRHHDQANVDVVYDSDSTSLLTQEPPLSPHGVHAYAVGGCRVSPSSSTVSSLLSSLRRAKALFVPYMIPMFLVYVAEYLINQGVAPTLLFPLESSPFTEMRSFYPFYGFLYQLGVFISRSSIPFVRIHHLYLPSLLQCANLAILVVQALSNFIPSVYIIFVIIFWEGLLGGAVYVNTFAEIMENVPHGEREFSLSATSVSDSAGICMAGFLGMVVEMSLCDWQVQHGRDWCRNIKIGG